MRIKIQKINNSLFLFIHNLSEFFRDIFSYLETKIYFGLIILTNIIVWFVSYRTYQLSPGSEEIALHYNVDFGINLIGNAKQLFIIPFAGVLISIFNLCLLYGMRNNVSDKRFNRHLILASTLVVNIFLLTASISLYIVNLNL